VDVHHGEFDQRGVQRVKEGFKCLVVIKGADEFPQILYVNFFVFQSSGGSGSVARAALRVPDLIKV
jgi:hypothetical protein